MMAAGMSVCLAGPPSGADPCPCWGFCVDESDCRACVFVFARPSLASCACAWACLVPAAWQTRVRWRSVRPEAFCVPDSPRVQLPACAGLWVVGVRWAI